MTPSWPGQPAAATQYARREAARYSSPGSSHRLRTCSQSAAAVAAIVYLFVKNVSPKPPFSSDLAIWISTGWLVVGILVVFGLMILKPGRLSEAAAIIGEGDARRERGLLDA